MNRIDLCFKALKKRKEKALVAFITAGDPGLKKTQDLILAFEKMGVDLLELGIPFSDPLADGPVIQASSQRALDRGTTLRQVLGLVTAARAQKANLPILFMSYYNPILQYGLERFASDARKAGVDGVIIPDLPPDEAQEAKRALSNKGIHLVFLLAPTSNQARRKRVAANSRGFIYYVSLTGVTGQRKALPRDFKKNLRLARQSSKLPICIGFGVSTPSQARIFSRASDGVIVGSAIVKELMAHPGMPAEHFAKRFVRPFVTAVKGKRSTHG